MASTRVASRSVRSAPQRWSMSQLASGWWWRGEGVDEEHVRGGMTVHIHVYSWRYLDNQRHFKRAAIAGDNLPALNLWPFECRLPYRCRAHSSRLPLSPPSPLDPSLCFFTPPALLFLSLPSHPPSLFQPQTPVSSP